MDGGYLIALVPFHRPPAGELEVLYSLPVLGEGRGLGGGDWIAVFIIWPVGKRAVSAHVLTLAGKALRGKPPVWGDPLALGQGVIGRGKLPAAHQVAVVQPIPLPGPEPQLLLRKPRQPCQLAVLLGASEREVEDPLITRAVSDGVLAVEPGHRLVVYPPEFASGKMGSALHQVQLELQVLQQALVPGVGAKGVDPLAPALYRLGLIGLHILLRHPADLSRHSGPAGLRLSVHRQAPRQRQQHDCGQ